jgi:L-erythro-3,5-diaminohexanoate dehydrogenase
MGHSDSSCKRIEELGVADIILQGDATKPVETMELLKQKNDGKLADIVINNVNISDTEMASILSTKDQGTIYFFSMATSFTKAALGAEGVGKDVNMIIGNGYTKGHAQISLEILRENKKLREIFERLYT